MSDEFSDKDRRRDRFNRRKKNKKGQKFNSKNSWNNWDSNLSKDYEQRYDHNFSVDNDEHNE